MHHAAARPSVSTAGHQGTTTLETRARSTAPEGLPPRERCRGGPERRIPDHPRAKRRLEPGIPSAAMVNAGPPTERLSVPSTLLPRRMRPSRPAQDGPYAPPRVRAVRDGRKASAQFRHGRQLPALFPGTADRSNGRFIDEEHATSLESHAARKQAIPRRGSASIRRRGRPGPGCTSGARLSHAWHRT